MWGQGPAGPLWVALGAEAMAVAEVGERGIGLSGGGAGEHVTATLERVEEGPWDLLRGPPAHLDRVEAIDLAVEHKGGRPDRGQELAEGDR